MTHLPRRLAAIGATLLITVAASCGSDESSDSTSPATAVSNAESTVETSTAESATETTTADDATGSTLDASGSGTVADRAAIVNLLLAQASNAGVDVDTECVLDIVSRLSDEDAKLLGDSARAGGGGTPELSDEGEALGEELNDCATLATVAS